MASTNFDDVDVSTGNAQMSQVPDIGIEGLAQMTMPGEVPTALGPQVAPMGGVPMSLELLQRALSKRKHLRAALDGLAEYSSEETAIDALTQPPFKGRYVSDIEDELAAQEALMAQQEAAIQAAAIGTAQSFDPLIESLKNPPTPKAPVPPQQPNPVSSLVSAVLSGFFPEEAGMLGMAPVQAAEQQRAQMQQTQDYEYQVQQTQYDATVRAQQLQLQAAQRKEDVEKEKQARMEKNINTLRMARADAQNDQLQYEAKISSQRQRVAEIISAGKYKNPDLLVNQYKDLSAKLNEPANITDAFVSSLVRQADYDRLTEELDPQIKLIMSAAGRIPVEETADNLLTALKQTVYSNRYPNLTEEDKLEKVATIQSLFEMLQVKPYSAQAAELQIRASAERLESQHKARMEEIREQNKGKAQVAGINKERATSVAEINARAKTASAGAAATEMSNAIKAGDYKTLVSGLRGAFKDIASTEASLKTYRDALAKSPANLELQANVSYLQDYRENVIMPRIRASAHSVMLGLAESIAKGDPAARDKTGKISLRYITKKIDQILTRPPYGLSKDDIAFMRRAISGG